MHFQQGTRNFDNPEIANEAIALVWEKKGFARRDDDSTLTIVADAAIFPEIRADLDALCKRHADLATQAQTASQEQEQEQGGEPASTGETTAPAGE